MGGVDLGKEALEEVLVHRARAVAVGAVPLRVRPTAAKVVMNPFKLLLSNKANAHPSVPNAHPLEALPHPGSALVTEAVEVLTSAASTPACSTTPANLPLDLAGDKFPTIF